MSEWKPTPIPNADLRAASLSSDELAVLWLVNGKLTVAELRAASGLGFENLRRVLGRLISTGMVAREQAPASSPTDEEDAEPPDATSGEHRKLFETQLHPLPADERAQLAQRAEEPVLSALCFDPVAEVVRRVLENTRAGLHHARLIAAHHRSSVGLEVVVNRQAYVHDAQVQRMLLRNPQLTEPQLRRVVGSQPLASLYRQVLSREVPEQTRRGLRTLFRTRFMQSAPEERVAVIFSTEGRVLAALTGVALDQKTTALLCARTYGSTLLVQGLGRWAATPPSVLQHLLRQPIVQRQPTLRGLLLQHANMPAGAKRSALEE